MAVRVGSRALAMPRFNRQIVIGILLAAVSASLVLYLTRPLERVPVLVAGSDLPAGTPLADADVAVRYVEDANGMIQGTSLGELAGWALHVPLLEGEPLLSSVVAPLDLVVAPKVLSLALPMEHAVLGRLARGDLVDVYVTHGSGLDGPTETKLIASEVFVVASEMSDAVGAGGDVHVLLAVDDELARILAGASRSGSVDLVKVNR